MSNNIVEENPVQQKSNAPQGQGAGGGQDKVRKQARQLAYDVRYKVKQGFKDGQKSDPASLKSAYISQLGRSPAPGPVKQLAKTMLVGEAYDFVDVKENATKNISNILGKVFTKTTQIDDVNGNPAYEITDVVQEDSAVRKYKVRVTDKKSGKSYTRMADRAKISELRKNPNIASVEMTGYGTPYEGEKKKGSQTAAVKSGKGLAKKDFDGDGKVESPTAEYKGSKDKAIKKALHKEEFIDEVNTEDDNPQANTKRIDVMKGKNKVKVMPNMGEQNELAPKGKDAPAKPEPDSKEKRVALMKRMILQKKMQAVRSGAGADIVAHNELEGEVIVDEGALVKTAQGIEKVGRVVKKGVKAFNKADAAVTKATVNRVIKPAAKAAGKVAKKGLKVAGKVALGTAKAAGRATVGGIKGAVKGALNKESYDKEPPIRDQDDQQIANVTFDGGGPDGGATIQGSGDPREIPTFVALIKNKMRARGILVNHNELEGEQLDELNKGERVKAGQGKRAAKKGDWSKQKASTGRRNMNRFETGTVKRTHSSGGRNPSYKKVTLGNPKPGYGKKDDHYNKNKIVTHKLSAHGTSSATEKGPQKHHSSGIEHHDSAQAQRRHEHKKRRGVKTKGTVAADIKKSMKETVSVTDTINQILESNSK